MNKKVSGIFKPHPPHMVGDGLPVINFFSYTDLGREQLSPFLMLDYGSPTEFPPTEKRLGVGMHPHRGFETVTFVFSGGIEHRDTAGNHGEIGAGDVQWMTAASGVMHEEMHSNNFRKNGGQLHFLQLWVNLPAELKMSKPEYQTLAKEDIPVVKFDDGKATARVVAGRLDGAVGPAKTSTPVNLYDVYLDPGAHVQFAVPSGFTTALVVMEGGVTVNGGSAVAAEKLILMDRAGERFDIGSPDGAHVMILNGQPIDEPVFGYGPFVMNSQEEILQAISDFRSGLF